MIYFWLLQLTALLSLLVAPYFSVLLPGVDILILSLLMLVLTPLLVPLVATIRADLTPMRPICTRA
jgi:hypothetical protein